MKSEFSRLVDKEPEKAKQLLIQLRSRKTTVQILALLGLKSNRTLNRIYHKLDLIRYRLELTEEDLQTRPRLVARKYHVSEAYVRRLMKDAETGRSGPKENMDAGSERRSRGPRNVP